MVRKVIIIFVLTVAAFSICAYHIDDQQAQRAAAGFISSKNPETVIKNWFSVQDTSSNLFYVFNTEPEGYVILSSDTDLPPIIAYSFYSRSLREDNFDPKFKLMLISDLKNRSSYYNNFPNETAENKTKWKNLLDNRANRDRPEYWPPEGSTETGGWVETIWHQNSPFHNFCPTDPYTNQRC